MRLESLEADIINRIIASGGFALLISMAGNLIQWKQNRSERRRTDDAIAERKELAKKYQDHLEDYNDKTAGNITVIQETGYTLKDVQTTINNNTKLLESFKCQYSRK